MTQFSICLPVKDGMPYLKESVQSILSQTNSDFELLILDNHSEDGTVEWLRTLTDPRIRVSFSDKSLNIVESWARIKHQPKQEFLTVIGHDDIFYPGFLQSISDLILKHPDASLYQTSGSFINSNGQKIRSLRAVPLIETPAIYLRARFAFRRDISGTGYVMRSSDYDRLGGIPNFERLYFADDALLLSLMRGSYKVCDPAEHFAIRCHSKSESASLPSSWKSILIGLGQFSNFLHNYEDDSRTRAIFNSLAPEFLLRYHRNAAILAVVEASEAGHRLEPEVVNEIENSLAVCAPSVSRCLWQSPKIALLRAINMSWTRVLIPLMWNIYCQLKNKTR